MAFSRSKKWLYGAAIPLVLAGGAATAAASSAPAASAAPAVTVAAHHPAYHQWQLRGPNQVKLTYQGSTYTYQVRFIQQRAYGQQYGPQWWAHQQDALLTGRLADSYLPGILPINGVVFGNHVVFSVVYPGNQGVRTFSGAIDSNGKVSGLWTETGSEAGSGPFTLAFPAR